MFHLKRRPNNYKWTPSRSKEETNGSIEFLQPYPVVAADALLEIGTAVISAVLSLDEHLSQTDTSCVPKLCYQSVYCCLIRYFIVQMRIAECFTNSSKISILSNIQEWTHVLLVNSPCSHLHSFCATGVSSGLATRMTFTRVLRGRLGESITRGWTCFWFHFCTIVRDCFGVAFQMVHSEVMANV
jgi:hypothetical protein